MRGEERGEGRCWEGAGEERGGERLLVLEGEQRVLVDRQLRLPLCDVHRRVERAHDLDGSSCAVGALCAQILGHHFVEIQIELCFLLVA